MQVFEAVLDKLAAFGPQNNADLVGSLGSKNIIGCANGAHVLRMSHFMRSPDTPAVRRLGSLVLWRDVARVEAFRGFVSNRSRSAGSGLADLSRRLAGNQAEETLAQRNRLVRSDLKIELNATDYEQRLNEFVLRLRDSKFPEQCVVE